MREGKRVGVPAGQRLDLPAGRRAHSVTAPAQANHHTARADALGRSGEGGGGGAEEGELTGSLLPEECRLLRTAYSDIVSMSGIV